MAERSRCLLAMSAAGVTQSGTAGPCVADTGALLRRACTVHVLERPVSASYQSIRLNNQFYCVSGHKDPYKHKKERQTLNHHSRTTVHRNAAIFKPVRAIDYILLS